MFRFMLSCTMNYYLMCCCVCIFTVFFSKIFSQFVQHFFMFIISGILCILETRQLLCNANDNQSNRGELLIVI